MHEADQLRPVHQERQSVAAEDASCPSSHLKELGTEVSPLVSCQVTLLLWSHEADQESSQLKHLCCLFLLHLHKEV